MNFITSLFQKRLIGLDIGTSGIKAVELSGTKSPRLIAYNRIPLPWNTITLDGEIRDRGTVVTALRKLFDSKQFSAKKVAVAASGNAVMTKKVTFPKMSHEELSHQLYFEAEQYIPFDIAEVNVDYAILGPSTGTSVTSGPAMDVLVVAAKKVYVDELASVVKEAGLHPEVIDSQAFALGNAYEFNYGYVEGKSGAGGLSVIIDFGAGSTKISVVEGDKTTFTRDLRLCGMNCTMVLAERLGVPPEQAEQLKIAEGSSPAIQTVLNEFNANLVEEIVRTIDYCVGQSSDHSIHGVFVCGGASKTEGLMRSLETRMPGAIQPLNPIQNVAGSGRKMNAQALRELAYLGAVAIGLALRHSGDSG